MSCCVDDNLNGTTCQTVLVKILSDFHLLPQGDIFVGPRSQDDFSNVTIVSHVRITLPFDPMLPDAALVPPQISISVSNGLLFFAPPICEINGTHCNIVFIPTPQNYGESQVNVVASYNSRTTSTSFRIRVGRVNHSPNFTIPFPLVTVPSSDSGVWSRSNFVMNVTAGPFDTDQSTAFVVHATNLTQAANAFLQLPQISNFVVLSFVLKPYVYGNFIFSCTLVDFPLSPLASNASLNSTLFFTITVTFVNQAPTFSFDSNLNVNVTANEMFAKHSFLKNVSAGPASEFWQTVTCKLTPNADYSRSFVVSPFIVISGSVGDLFLQLAAGRSGTFYFNLLCKDNGGGGADRGVDSAQPVIVSLTVPFSNSPPSLDTVVRSVNLNSSAMSSYFSFQIVNIPAPASFCTPHVVCSCVCVSFRSVPL